MKWNKCFAMAACFLGTAIIASAYRADMSGSDAPVAGSVVGALKQVETSMVNGQYNRALMQVRNVE